MIRELKKEDIERVKQIHKKFFEDEFDFPTFFDKFLCAFVILDDNNNDIIACGGVRTLAESVLITNKDYSPRERRKALYEVLNASSFIAGKAKYDSIHAFVQDPEWMHHLRRVGFHECIGKAIYLPL